MQVMAKSEIPKAKTSNEGKSRKVVRLTTMMQVVATPRSVF